MKKTESGPDEWGTGFSDNGAQLVLKVLEFSKSWNWILYGRRRDHWESYMTIYRSGRPLHRSKQTYQLVACSTGPSTITSMIGPAEEANSLADRTSRWLVGAIEGSNSRWHSRRHPPFHVTLDLESKKHDGCGCFHRCVGVWPCCIPACTCGNLAWNG